MTAVIATGHAPWIPVAHRMELVRAGEQPTERELVTAAFVLVFDACRQLLLTHVNLPGRSWDVPGGHIDAEENPAGAAIRETAEETGLQLFPDDLRLVGWQRFTLLSPPPATYPYPYPLSYTLMFTAQTTLTAPPVEPHQGSECGPAGWFTQDQVIARCGRCSWLPFMHSVLAD